MSDADRLDSKSVILAVLVLISLGLTAKIWLGLPTSSGAYEPFRPRTQQVQDAGLASLLAPKLMLIHNGPGNHLGLVPNTPDYDKVWDKGQAMRQLLSAVVGVRREPAGVAEVLQARADSYALEVVLEDAHRLGELARVYGVTLDADVVIDRLILSYGKGPAIYARVYPSLTYVALSLKPEASDFLGKLRNLTPEQQVRYVELQEEIGDMKLAPGTFVPAERKPMALLSVQRDPSGASTVLSTFFVDVSLLRRIEERDGALIYSDGRRGVRIYPSGAMDYGRPEPGGTEIPKIQALEKAAIFALEHGGLPGTAYAGRAVSVKTPTHEATRVLFNFRYQGTPILGARGVIEVSVSSKGPEGFQRNLRAPVGEIGVPRPVITPREAVNAIGARRRLVFGEANPGQIVSIELAYLNGAQDEPIEPLRPVWSVDFDSGWSVVVDAHNGTVSRRINP